MFMFNQMLKAIEAKGTMGPNDAQIIIIICPCVGCCFWCNVAPECGNAPLASCVLLFLRPLMPLVGVNKVVRV